MHKHAFQVKAALGYGGVGTEIARNPQQLAAAIARQQTSQYGLYEAVLGNQELGLYFVARHGKLLGVFCNILLQQHDLFVVSVTELHRKQTMSCHDVEPVSPVIHVIKRVVALSSYNGLGCVNYKLLAHNGQPYTFHSKLRTYPYATADLIMTDFETIQSSMDMSRAEAIPKIFEINSRMCHSLTFHPEILHAMLQLYSANV